MRPGRRLAEDTGSAVVDFTLTSVLQLFVFMAVIQLGLALHVRNTLISCAAEGARYGAREGASPAQGAQRTRDLVTRTLSSRFAGDVTTSTDTTAAGVRVVVVSVDAPIPIIGPLGPDDGLHVRGRAFAESQ